MVQKTGRLKYLSNNVLPKESTSKKISIIQIEGKREYKFEFIHLFSNGNGRIGRLWQSVILHQWKPIFSSMPTESIIRDHQEAYYVALEAAGEMGESTPFVEFMLEMILQTIQNVPKDRSVLILDQLTKTPEMSVRQLSELLSVSDKTIKRDLEKLKNEHKIERIGSNRKGYWQIIQTDIDCRTHNPKAVEYIGYLR